MPEKCQICKKVAHGAHYGAQTCRACAAFFRRTASQRFILTCGKSNKCCEDRNFNGKHCCKKCRLEICFDEGMTLDNFQYQRDPFSTTQKSKSGAEKTAPKKDSISENEQSPIPMTVERFVGRPHMLLQCEPDLASTTKKFIDLDFLVQKTRKVLEKAVGSKNMNLNLYQSQLSLESLSFRLKKLRRGTPGGKMKVYRKIGKTEFFAIWEYELLRSARWFSEFDAFRDLVIQDKIQFMFKTWYVWGLFDKLALTAQKRESKECGDYFAMINDNAMLDLRNTELDFSWCTKYGRSQMSYFIGAQDSWMTVEIIKILRKMQPTEIEQSYIIAQTCLNYAAKSSPSSRAIEKMQETITNEIHVYYTEVLKMPNYAGRLAQLLKCDRLLQNYTYQRRRKAELARLFDVYSIRVSHPEMFEFNGY